MFKILRTLTEQGKSIIFITHKLREVMDVADRITVLRLGRTVGTVKPKETDQQHLASMMVGREVNLIVDKEAAQPGEVVLAVKDLVRIGRAPAMSRSTAFPSTSAPAKSWALPACRATARPNWSTRSPACGRRSAGRSRSQASR